MLTGATGGKDIWGKVIRVEHLADDKKCSLDPLKGKVFAGVGEGGIGIQSLDSLEEKSFGERNGDAED